MKIYEAKISYNLLRMGEECQLDCQEKVVEYMAGAFDEDPTIEWIYVIELNRKNLPLGRTVITRGTASSTLFHPREVLRPVILANAPAFILVHNHPSGDPTPSRADIHITRQMKQAAETMNIDFLDHIIIGDKDVDPEGGGYYSFNEAGIII